MDYWRWAFVINLNNMMQIFFDRVFGRLFWRKLYHFAGGALLLTALIILQANWFLFLLLVYLAAFRIFAKRISFAVLGMLMLLVVSQSVLTTFAAGVVLFVGDGMAAVVGAAWGRRKWHINPHKSVWGSVAFLASAFLSLLMALEMLMPAQQAALILAFFTALGGAVAEMLPLNMIRDRKPDDNLIVLAVSGMIFYGMCLWLGIPLTEGR